MVPGEVTARPVGARVPVPWVTHVSLPCSAEEEDEDVADVSRVPADVLRNVEADTYWCMSRLLDGIQVSPAPGARQPPPSLPRSLPPEQSVLLGGVARRCRGGAQTTVGGPTEARFCGWPAPTVSRRWGRSCGEEGPPPPNEAGNAGPC